MTIIYYFVFLFFNFINFHLKFFHKIDKQVHTSNLLLSAGTCYYVYSKYTLNIDLRYNIMSYILTSDLDYYSVHINLWMNKIHCPNDNR